MALEYELDTGHPQNITLQVLSFRKNNFTRNINIKIFLEKSKLIGAIVTQCCYIL